MMDEKRLKIGYVMQADAVDMSNTSGPQLHVKAVFKGFKERGHFARIVAIQKHQIQWSDDLIEWFPGEFHASASKPFRLVESTFRRIQNDLRLPFFRLFDSYRFSDACFSAFQDFDILYERDGTMSYGGIMAARRLGIPIVLEVNGDLIDEWKQLDIQWSTTQNRIVEFITRQTYRHASHIIAVGETIRQRLIKRWSLHPSHVSVVTNGADVDLFLSTNEASETKSKLALGNGPIVIFTGSFQPWHGVGLIVEAFHHCTNSIPDARLLLVGDGPFKSQIQEQVLALNISGKVIFTGRVDHTEVARLLSAADIAVIYHCGDAAEIVETPLKLFEYMAAGKAIIAPAVLNMQRVLVDHVNAVLVPPDRPTILANAMIDLIRDSQLRSTLGQAARNEAIQKHSWNRAVAEIESILYRLCPDENARS